MATEEEQKPRPIKERFEAGVNVIRSLPKEGSFQPSNSMKLRFYALYKQIKAGPCNIAKPAFWDPTGRAKWEAWNVCGNMSTELAMQLYVEELQRFVETMPHSKEVEEFLEVIGAFYEVVEEGDGDKEAEPDKGEGALDEGAGSDKGDEPGDKGPESGEDEGGSESESNGSDEFQETFEDLPRQKNSTPRIQPTSLQPSQPLPYDPVCLQKSQPLPPLQEQSDSTYQQQTSRLLPSFDPTCLDKSLPIPGTSKADTSHPGLHIDSRTPVLHQKHVSTGFEQTDGSGDKGTTLLSSRYSQSKSTMDGNPSRTSRVITQENRRQQTPYVATGNIHPQRKQVNHLASSNLTAETSSRIGLVGTGQSGFSGSTIHFDTPGSIPLALQAVAAQLSHLQGNLQSMLQQLNTLAVAVHGLTQLQQQHASSVSQVHGAELPTQAELVPTLIMRRGRLLTVCLRLVPMVIVWPVVVNIIMSFICRRFGRQGGSALPSWVWGVLTLLHSLMALAHGYSNRIL